MQYVCNFSFVLLDVRPRARQGAERIRHGERHLNRPRRGRSNEAISPRIPVPLIAYELSRARGHDRDNISILHPCFLRLDMKFWHVIGTCWATFYKSQKKKVLWRPAQRFFWSLRQGNVQQKYKMHLLCKLWYTSARWQGGCVSDASRVGDTVQWIAWRTWVLPCWEDIKML